MDNISTEIEGDEPTRDTVRRFPGLILAEGQAGGRTRKKPENIKPEADQAQAAVGFCPFEKTAGQAEKMSGVHKSSADAFGQIDCSAITAPAERLEALERIGPGERRLSRLIIRAARRRAVCPMK